MAARLKVFTWSDGFHAFTVATSSKPKALAAWGIGQDIFKSGLAHEVTEGPAHDAALAAPGEVIQKGEAVDVGALGKARTAKPKPGPTAAQKARVASLQEALDRMDAVHAEALAGVDEQIQALEKRRDGLEADQRGERLDLVARLKTAREKL
ncbi:hypothetical protein BH09PSE1_BH09PSE1_23740 [soil metagenome]